MRQNPNYIEKDKAQASARAWRELAIANGDIVDEIREIVGLTGKPGNVVEAVRKLVALRDGETKQPAPPVVDERTSNARRLVAKLAAHVRPTCSELWHEAQAFLAAEDVQAAETEALREVLAALKAENEMLSEALKDADNELDWLDKDMDKCDHSVGVCMCSYWYMRRKMKATLAKLESGHS